MIERPVPQDILKYKQKAIGNYSARELIFGTIGAGIIIYNIFNVFTMIDNASMRALISAVPAIPFLAIGFGTIYGVTVEKIIIPLVCDNFICPIKRKKEVHYKELEQFEKSRYWIEKKGQKITCKKSKTYKGIQ